MSLYFRSRSERPDEIDRAMLRCGHEPRAGIRRDALAWPLFERSDERSVREIFGDADVVRDAVRPAIRRGDSMRQTASIAGCVSAFGPG